VDMTVPFSGIKMTISPETKKAMDDPATAKLVGALQNSIDLVGRMRSQGAVTEDEWKSFSRIMLGTTPTTFATNMSQFRKFIEEKQRRALDQADDDTLEEFGRRRRR
jgi:phosphoribosylformimino-5-aminoimidazole carboxamide ribonucleotide (ProFAR) isomerase